MFHTCFTLAVAIALSAIVCAQQSQPLIEAARTGRKIFQTRCAMCHIGQDPATEMAGDTDAARRPATMGPLLSKAQAADEDKLREKIKNGGARMPGYNLALNGEQINQLIAFLKTADRPITRLAIVRAGE